jgi:carbon monoxide dehydrogenase subunit G
VIAAGATTLPVAATRLIGVLRDPDTLAAALPNTDLAGTLPRADETFAVTIRPAIALGEIPIRTLWKPIAAEHAEELRFRVDGRTDEHAVTLDVRVSATDSDDGGCRATWEVRGVFTGTLGSVGQRVVSAIVEQQARLVLDAAARLAA